MNKKQATDEIGTNEKRCAVCGSTFSSSGGRAVCTDCYVTRHNREPGQRQADAVDRPGVRANPLRPVIGSPADYHVRRTWAVRLAEGFAMLGGAG